MKRTQLVKGLTLVETMLALAVAGGILVLSIASYRTLGNQSSNQQFMANVDTVFQAMSRFYYFNCQNMNIVDSGGPYVYQGILDPSNTPQVSLQYPTPVDLTAAGNLVGMKFLSLNQIKVTPLMTTMYAQFNPLVQNSPTLNSCTSPTYCTTTSQTLAVSNMKILTFIIQVGVLLPANTSASAANTYQATFGADCVSQLESDNQTVHPCSDNTGGAAGNYVLVWTRLPSLASPNSSSPVWQTLPTLKQFKLQYTHDQMYELSTPSTNYYYLCNG